MSGEIFVTSYQPHEEGVRIKNVLHRWRRKVLKALDEGLFAVNVSYKANIPIEISDAVRSNLKNAKTPSEVEEAFEEVIRHYLLGRIGRRPEDRNKPIPSIPVDIEITESNIDRAIYKFDRWAEENAPDLVGLLDAEVIDDEENPNETGASKNNIIAS